MREQRRIRDSGILQSSKRFAIESLYLKALFLFSKFLTGSLSLSYFPDFSTIQCDKSVISSTYDFVEPHKYYF